MFVRAVDVSIEVTEMAGPDPVEITFDRSTTITVGGRSLHTRPEATITVPDDPEALMTAVSALGSSIAEWSPERSWPTLRGYPPRIERGDELHVPDHLSIPDTGIEIAVPPTYADIYRIAPLAYYLGAAVVPGAEPEIRLDTGYVEPLPSEGPALEERVSELLRTTLFLDSLVRTEGYVPSDRYEYEQVGPDLPFYPPKLADRSVSEQLMEYLEVDPELLEPYAPPWPTWAVLRPGPAGAELLSHLAHLVAPIRVRGSALDEKREDDGVDVNAPTPDRPLALATSPYFPVDGGVPSPDDEPLPSGVSVLSPAGYERLLSGHRPNKGDVRVAFLVDSDERADAVRRAMSEPAPPDGVGSWEVHESPNRETVVEVLTDPTVDLLYCSLPTDGSRIARADGTVELVEFGSLPVATVFERTGTVAPAHRSVVAGSLGSVAIDGTLDASRIRSLVGLLASATPLALSVALTGVQAVSDVLLAGDPGVVTTISGSGITSAAWVRSRSPTEHDFECHHPLSTGLRIGTEAVLSLDWTPQHPALFGILTAEPGPISTTQVVEFLNEPDTSVDLNGQVVFQSDGLTESDIERFAREMLANEHEMSDRPDMRSLIQPDSE